MIVNPWRALRERRDQISSLRANLDQALDQNEQHVAARTELARDNARLMQQVGQLRDQIRKRQEYGRDNVDLRQEIAIRDARIAAFRDESERMRSRCTCDALEPDPEPVDPYEAHW